MRIPAAFLLFVLASSGQQPGGEFKLSVSSNLVIVNVGARTKDGKALEGLKAPDFVVLEDGKPQKISVFEFQRLEDPAAAVEPSTPGVAPASQPQQPVVPKGVIATSKAGEVRYKDRRLLVLFFDFSSMGEPDQARARQAALKFLETGMTPSDLVAIMTFSSTLDVAQDFTADRDRLQQVIKSFRLGEGSELSATASTGDDDDTAEDNGAAFAADDSEFNIFNTDRKLGALETAARMLSTLPEKKALVYFSSGAGRTGVENNSQLRATINQAMRANISFYPVDARGLVATAPAGDATRGSTRGSGMYSGNSQRSMRANFEAQQETLETLAADTGGKALLDSNDLALGIRQAQKDISSYYILGYYSTNPAMDGRYRRIKVEVQQDPRAKLDYRSGYFAAKEFRNFNSTDRERQLEDALALGDPITDLPLALEVNWFRMAKDRYFVPVAVKMPGSAIELARSGKGGEAQLDFIGQVRDSRGHMAGVVRDYIKINLKAETATRLGQRNIQYDSGFLLPPGDYTLKFLARENETGKIGTFETKFNVPDLVTEKAWLRTSTVVWSNQREALSAAVGRAEKNNKLLASHPLVANGEKLVPSITRVYRTDQDLYMYVEVYDAAKGPQGGAPEIAASLSLFHGRTKVFESAPVQVTVPADKRYETLPVRLQASLASLKPGRYTCQVNVIDERGKKFAFARAPLVLVAKQ